TADLNSATSVGVVFGGPYRGIYDLVSDKNRLRDACDYIINFIPNQGTRTVRTEEAIFSTMAILNMLTSL
ncbi:MAG: putative RNA uridine N3 methyltransferase, partial [Candidatus Odinarchaeia archaeon]